MRVLKYFVEMLMNYRSVLTPILVLVMHALLPSASKGSAMDVPARPNMTISVDARTPWNSRIPVKMALGVNPGPITLVFPRWLPGMHAAEGPLGNFGRFSLAVDGAPLSWQRDPYDPYLIKATVPAGGKVLTASYDYIAPRNRADEVFYGIAAGHDVAVLNPSAFSVAPECDPRTLTTSLKLTVPVGWRVSSAMALESPNATGTGTEALTFTYAPVSLYTLIDSPIMAGRYHRSITLASPAGDVKHILDLYADNDETLQKKIAVVTPLFNRLVAESWKMFGGRHYHAFHFMLALSNEVGRNGLEHHEGVAYVLQPDDLDDSRKQMPGNGWNAMLIPHEFVHSWNGKFRRPYGEDAHSNNAAQSADLIWMYEGLTQYLGDVLMVRAGFRTAGAFRIDLFNRASSMRYGAGRDWESLADTALVAPYTYIHGTGTALRGVNDVYYEGELAWLEADAIIRKQTHGQRSLDDFCQLFFGGANRGAEVIPYTRTEIIEALNLICTYDWSNFIQTRFYAPPAALPFAGLEKTGYKVTYTDTPASNGGQAIPDYRPSFGAYITGTGAIVDVVTASAAEHAGLEVGMTILGVNGTLFSASSLQDGVRATRGRQNTLDLLIAVDNHYRTVRVNGLDGARFPNLVRDTTQPDLFGAICGSASK